MSSRQQTMSDMQVLRYAEAMLWDSLAIRPREPIVSWASHAVDLSYDITSHAAGLIELYPYQMAPLAASEQPGVNEITLMWGQRLGKSTTWKLSMLKRVTDGGLSGLIIYPSLELGLKTNRDTVLPLLRTLPAAKRDLAMPGSKKKDSYHLPSCRSVVYFIGGGAQAISYTANWGVIDEADYVKMEKSDEEGQNTNQVTALRIRMKTFADRLLWVVSSATTYGGIINENFKRGSREYWHLACLKCDAKHPSNQLAFPLGDGTYAGLQWDKDATGNVIADSIRYICPRCGHAHVYAEAAEMNERGGYIAENPHKTEHRSFQAGALSNPKLWTWLEIAEAQEAATDPDAKKYLANTIKGMPYKHTREGDISISITDVLESKRGAYSDDIPARLSLVCAGADQQKNGLAGAKYYPYTVRGWDEEGNSWQIASGIANNLEELSAVTSATYHGLPIALAMIDQGGFDNSQDMDLFIAAHANCWYYKGEDDRTLKGKAWAGSETNSKLILANALHYQGKLLDLLYGPPRPAGYKWCIMDDASQDYMEQMGSMRPNTRMRNGDAYVNWIATTRRDYFDAEKMALVALDVACYYIPPERFRFRNKPLFIRRELLAAIVRMKKLQAAPPAVS